MKKVFYTFVLLSLVLLISSCKEKKPSREQLYKENFETNVKACMQPLLEKGVDSVTARSLCACYFDTMFAVDSTFFMEKDPIAMDSIYNVHQTEIYNNCGEWLEKVRIEKQKSSD